MPRLIWVFAGSACHLLVLSWGGSYLDFHHPNTVKIQNNSTPALMCPKDVDWMANNVDPDLKAPSVAIWSGSLLLLRVFPNMSRIMTKPTKWSLCPAQTQISQGICQIWSESSLSVWRKLGSIATHLAHSEDSDQTRRMPRLIWVFAECTSLYWFSHDVAHI